MSSEKKLPRRLAHLPQLAPKNEHGKTFPMEPDENFEQLLRIGGKRTHRFAISLAMGSVDLKEAMGAAYLQGMYDAVLIYRDESPSMTKETTQ